MNICVSRILLLSVVALPGICPGAEVAQPLFNHSSTESMVVVRDPETSAPVTKHTSVNYHKLWLGLPYDRELIARETIIQEQADATDGGTATASVDLFYRNEDQSYSSTPDVTTTVSEASEIHFDADHWTAVTWTCCDSQSLIQLFAYGESKPFLFTNSQYAQAMLPNAGVTRYIGVVLRSQTPLEEQEKAIFGSDEKAVAAIFYAAPDKPLHKLLLQPKAGVKVEDVPFRVVDLDLKSNSPKDEDGMTDNQRISKVRTLWSQDTLPGAKPPTTISGLSIVISLLGVDSETEKITVPVEKDRFGTPKFSGKTLEVLKEK